MKLAHGEAMRAVIRAQVKRRVAVRASDESALDRDAQRRRREAMEAFFARAPMPVRPDRGR